MLGSSSGVPYWHHATASSPSKTRAACALPSRTRRSFQGRPFSPSGLPSREWNHVHQQPPNPHPLCLSSSRAYASHVDASSALISYSLTARGSYELWDSRCVSVSEQREPDGDRGRDHESPRRQRTRRDLFFLVGLDRT